MKYEKPMILSEDSMESKLLYGSCFEYGPCPSRSTPSGSCTQTPTSSN